MGPNSMSLLLLVAICNIVSVLTTSYPLEFIKQVQDYPNIITDSTTRCAPLPGNYKTAENYVCDPDKLLSVEEMVALNSQIYEIRNSINKEAIETCNPDKPRPSIAIAIVKDMKIGEKKNEDVLKYASVFAYYLFDEWKLSTSCSSGLDKLVIFYSKQDGSLYTYAGNALDRRLSSKAIIRVAVASKPFFGSNIGSGLKYILERYKNIFMGRDKGILSS